MLRRLAIVTMLAFSIWAIAASIDTSNRLAFACSCAEQQPPKEALEQSTAVFSGRVIDLNKVNNYTWEAVFDVNEAWKGVSEDIVTVATSGDFCSYGFQKDNEYLVYAYEIAGHLETSSCSRTSLLSNAEADFVSLGQGDSTFAGERASFTGVKVANFSYAFIGAFVAVGATIAGVIAFLTLRRRKQ